MASSVLQFVISVIGVVVFAGLTAWDTQRLKNEYLYGAMDGETTERSAIIGALSLTSTSSTCSRCCCSCSASATNKPRRQVPQVKGPGSPGPVSCQIG